MSVQISKLFPKNPDDQLFLHVHLWFVLEHRFNQSEHLVVLANSLSDSRLWESVTLNARHSIHNCHLQLGWMTPLGSDTLYGVI